MGTISDKLTYLNETKSQLKDMINYGLPTENQITNETTFRNYVKGIFEAFIESLRDSTTLYTNLPKISGNGTQITLNDTANVPMRITLKASELSQDASPTPDTPQDIHTISGDNSIVVSGKNLCNTFIATKPSWQAGTLVVNSDGSFIVSGNTGSNNYFQLNQKVRVLCPSLKAGDVVYLYLETTNTNKRIYASGMGGGGWYSGNSLTITDTILNNNLVIYGGYNQTDTIKITITKEQVATEYVPYQEPQTAQLNLPVENLFDKDNANVLEAYFDTGNTTITSNANNRIIYIKCKPNTTYTFQRVAPTWNGVCIGYTKEVPAQNKQVYGVVAFTTNTSSKTITTENEAQYLVFRCYNAANDSAYTFNEIKNSIQIEEGTKANSYTPYGTTPIEYCKIGNYEDEFILNSGKNLLDTKIFENRMINCYVVNSNGTITQTATDTNYWQSSYLPNSIILNKGTYTISVNNRNGSKLQVYNLTTNSNIVEALVDSYTFTLNNDNQVINVKLYGASSYPFTFTMQLEEGSTATSYEPYGTNQWYLKKNIGKVVLDGTQTISYNGSATTPTNRTTFRFSLPSNALTTDFISDRFIQDSTTSNRYVPVANSDRPYISFDDTILGITSGDTNAQKESKCTAWLTNNNVTIEYPISPTYTQITGTLETQLNNIYEKLLSYKGTTNISQVNNDLPFVLGVSAIQDLE